MSRLGNLIVNVGANTKEFNKELGKVNRDIGRLTGNIQKMGKELSMAVTLPIAALGVTAVQAFDKQAKAVAQVEAGLKATGNAAGFTSDQLQKMASDLQQTTLFGDEEILQGATAQLLTFTNIAGDQFARTQKAALDLATRLDGDLKGASIQLGKALNDPVANLSALSRSGIQFSDQQKGVIKALAETGRIAEAQTVILDELEKQYGGSADAAAKAGTGGIKQLQNAFGDLQEEFGKIIVDMLPPLINGFKSVVKSFSELSDGTKKAIVVISGIAAAIGPILIIVPQLVKGFMLIRVALLQSVIPAVMKLNAVLLANPYILVAAGVAALTAAYFAFRKTSNEVYDVQSKIASAQQEAIKLASSEAVEVEKLSRKVEDTNLSQRQRIEALDELRRIAPDYFGDLDTETTLMDGLKNAVDEYRKSLVKAAEARVYQKMLDEAIEAQVQFQMEVKQMAKDLGITEDEARAVSGAMGAAMSDGADFARSNSELIDELTGKLQELESEGYGGASSGVNALGASSKQAFGSMISDAEEANKKLTDLEWAMHNLFQIDASTDLDKLAKDVEMRGGTMIIEDIEMPEEDGFNVDELDFMKEKVDEYYANQEERMNNAIALSQQLGGAMSAMFGQIIDGSAGGAEAMKSMAMSVFKSLLNMAKAAAVASAAQSAAAKGPLAAYALPALTAASFGLVEGLLGAVAFADGGIVSGPTLGMVGEYSGARNNPEVIAPLDKLQNMIGGTGGGQEVTVQGKISGNDIELVRERGVDNLRRSRGGSRRS